MAQKIQLANRTYCICCEQFYAASIMKIWIEEGKQQELSIRNAGKGIENCIVVTIKDRNGDDLSLINKIVTMTNARLHII